ncbi:hypothetical protein DPMN_071889 [Dreissena polymorpha]|uniref:Uncharacterized protein n=1 Tax=Dreissena polymorpha TaxID=45954 RepID=A0A9D3Z7F2_DREPO|nr:hypothetical protein DPMN_071889 [Dreissena polymorpha]
MWADGQRTKTNPKTSSEQSGKLPHPPGSHSHDDWAKIHVIQLTGTIFQLNSRIKQTNVLTKFHENWAKNVTSRGFTCFHYIHIEKNSPPTGGHVFSPIWTIFELVRHINKTNVLINFHDDWAKIVTSGLYKENCPAHWRPYWALNVTSTFQTQSRFHWDKSSDQFQEDRTINVASRVFTNKCGRTDDGQRPVTKSHLSNQYGGHLSKQDIIGTNLLTKFHKDRKINVASRENAPPLGSHVFQPTGISFELVQDIIGMDLLTKFHEDRTENVASRPFFPANIIIFKLIQDIINTNLLTKFNEDWAINVASRVLTRFYYSHIKPYKEKCPAPGGHVFKATKTIFKLIKDIIGTNLLTKKIAPPPRGSHVFQPTGIIFELVQDIICMNLLTKFHEDRTINVASREKCPAPLAAIFLKQTKNAPPPSCHVFQPTSIIFTLFHKDRTINVASRVKNAPPVTIFELIQDISGTNLLSKFHKDRKINVASRVLTRFYYSHIRKNAPPLGSCVFQAKITIFKLIQDISGTNLLSKFHENRKINVASRVLTRKNAPPPGGQVFQPTGIIFELVQDIIGMNLLTKFHEDRTINVAYRVLTRKTAPPPGGHVIKQTGVIFELVQDIIGMNLLTKFHEDRTINVASGVLTRFNYSHKYSHIRKNATPLGSHVFQAKVTIFELIQEISGTNLLSKFHEDRKINVVSRVLTRKNAPPRGSHVFQPTSIIFELFYEEQTINVASRGHTRNFNIFEHAARPPRPPPRPPRQHQSISRDFFEKNPANKKKCPEDWTINVAYRELTRQVLTPHNGHRTTDKKR